MAFFEFLIFVIVAMIILYLGFSFFIRKPKKQEAKPQQTLLKFTLKKAFTNKTLLIFYPAILIILVLLTASYWDDFKKASYYKEIIDEGKVIKTAPFHKNIFSALENICGQYTRLRQDEIHDVAHKDLWDILMNIKEIVVKMSFASERYSVENYYSIKNWRSERYIDGSKFYSTTSLKLKKEGKKVHKFKFWFSPGIIKKESQPESYIRFYVKPPKKESEWREIDYESYDVFSLANQTQKINEIEAQLKLRKDDFDKDGYAEIKIEVKHEQTIPYSLYYLPVFRYTKEIEKFELITYFREELVEYEIGCYDRQEGEIWWSKDCSKFKKPAVHTIDSLVWEPDGDRIENVFSYIIELKNYSLDTILFKYRQQWNRWAQ